MLLNHGAKPIKAIQGEHVMSQMTSLYDRLGGLDAITAVVDAVVARDAADARINRKFVRSDVPRLRKEFIDQVCEATGGPCTYTGRNMRDTHAGMKVTNGEFDAFIEDLEAALDEFKIPETDQRELLDLLMSLRGEIVEVKSLETGTALPDSYQPAPPLS
jgi:hemoglobin